MGYRQRTVMSVMGFLEPDNCIYLTLEGFFSPKGEVVLSLTPVEYFHLLFTMTQIN